MRKRLLKFFAISTLAMAVVVFGQETTPQSTNPGPEYQKMAGLIGHRKSTGEQIDSPLGSAQTQAISITSDWFPGGFAVVRHLDGTKSSSGEYHGLQILTHDHVSKDYPWHWFDNSGSAGLSRVSISDDGLIETPESTAKGKTYKVRGKMTGLGTDKISWVQEYSEDGKTWTPYYHSVDKRVR
jgi:hypothetical protein